MIKKNSAVMQWKTNKIKIQNVEHVQGTAIGHIIKTTDVGLSFMKTLKLGREIKTNIIIYVI